LDRMRIEKLTKVYNRHSVVNAFNLSVAAGEFCVILGPSGSGKSTIMNMIGGFTPPTSGEVYLDGVPITGLAPYKRDLGMMFQGYALFPHLTVFENVAFPLRARGTNNRELRNRVERILETVELSVLAHRLPHELSGGQQQRTALARALVFGPKLLLMDEPLAALDRRLRERMQSEIRMIQRRLAITVLYITHDQQEAMILADKVVIINQGQVEQVGEPIDVYRQPRTRFVSEFLGESNILDATVESIEQNEILCRTSAGLSIAATTDAPMTLGVRVAIAIRPERVHFSTDAITQTNRLAGHIADIVDIGFMRRYQVILSETENNFLVLEQGAQNTANRKSGDRVVLTFGKEDAVLVAK
jgi:putative spermidine/putrescine transport system ATP-binding protein